MTRLCVPLVVLGSLGLCSCGVYQIATAPDDDTRGMYGVTALGCPPFLITGTSPFERSSTEENEKKLPYYARVIRTRNLGKMTSDNARIILLAMEEAFQLKSVCTMSEKQVVELFGPPDRRSVENGRIEYDYWIQGPPLRKGNPLFLKAPSRK